MVVWFHSQMLIDESNGVERLWTQIAAVGWVGVDLFFVLSGFLITGILLDTSDSSNYFRNFFMRRVLRIFPLYYGTLAVILLLILSSFEGRTGYWFYLQNWHPLFYDSILPKILQPFWSLAVEEQFYLIWPFVVFFLPRKALRWFCGFTVITVLAARCYGIFQGTNLWLIYTATFFRIDSLVYGALLAEILRVPRDRETLRRISLTVLATSIAALLAVTFLNNGFNMGGAWCQTFGYTLIALASAAIISLTLNAGPFMKPIVRTLECRVLRYLGNRSYAMYVFHMPVILFVGKFYESKWQMTDQHSTGDFVSLIIAIAITVFLAELSWHAYEKHFLKLKRFFPRHSEIPDSERHPSQTLPSDGMNSTTNHSAAL